MEKIRIYTREDEYNKIRYYQDFKIVDELPYIGQEYDGGQFKVIEINEMTKDCEQGAVDAWKYDIYEVVAEDTWEKCDPNYYDYQYLAVENAVFDEDSIVEKMTKRSHCKIKNPVKHKINENVSYGPNLDMTNINLYNGLVELLATELDGAWNSGSLDTLSDEDRRAAHEAVQYVLDEYIDDILNRFQADVMSHNKDDNYAHWTEFLIKNCPNEKLQFTDDLEECCRKDTLKEMIGW